MEIGDKVAQTSYGTWIFYCPGCKGHHGFDKRWTFNGDKKNPTFSPSLLYPNKPRCHSFVRDGKIQYLGDCDHELAGQTVEIPDIDF